MKSGGGEVKSGGGGATVICNITVGASRGGLAPHELDQIKL